MQLELTLERVDPRTAFSTQQFCRRLTASATTNQCTCSSYSSNTCGNSPSTGANTSNTCTIKNSAIGENACHAKNTLDSAANGRFCNQYKSRKTKLNVFLLIYLCAIPVRTAHAIPLTSSTTSGHRLILHTTQYRQRHHQQLLQEQRSQVPTIHHHHLHHRSVGDIPAPDAMQQQQLDAAIGAASYSDYCKALKNPQKQAEATFNYIRRCFDDYALNQFGQKASVLHVEWEKHNFSLPHPYTHHVIRNFDLVPDESHFGHIVNKPIDGEILSDEMQKIYTTLKLLDKVFAEVIADRRQNHDRLLHQLGSKLNKVNEYFDEAHKHVSRDLQETKVAMSDLKIPTPRVDDASVTFNRESPVRDLLLAREHLSVMQYLRVLYNILLDKCSMAE